MLAQVVFGILGGLIGGVALGCTRLFASRLKRLVGLYGGALLLMYFLEYWNMLSGEARAAGQQSLLPASEAFVACFRRGSA
jgi:hypothetical protein